MARRIANSAFSVCGFGASGVIEVVGVVVDTVVTGEIVVGIVVVIVLAVALFVANSAIVGSGGMVNDTAHETGSTENRSIAFHVPFTSL